ncbi:hypothetical protein AVEN_191650-1 [Araneus ventricosus]|uniref:Uncharacterized protein n=1 Tax=Araneus ventricosus TaxID=182803 RepID=A0A4Y2MLL1_ARAVE|nr:hypothetical protein AVEN_191650-1 [Araneus ventricosus]
MEPWEKRGNDPGHGPFSTYLYRFNLITSEYCSCGGIGSKLHYAIECPLIESWHLRKHASHHIHVCLRQVAGNLQSRNKIVLQTWKVASQQCKSYGWEEGFTRLSME